MYTPGPWRVDSAPSSWKDALAIQSAGGTIAFTTRGFEWDENGDGCPSYANARLIASAPDLLAALKGALCDLEMRIKVKDSQWDGEASEHSSIGKARIAIAKAEGK